MKKNYTIVNYLTVAGIALFSLSVFSQPTLNFTMDTAIDNGVTITETLVDGSDNYTLTVNHSGNEELDDLGGGDLIFYLSAIDPLTPYTLSVTKNGAPYNFTLNSMDYDTLESGFISLESNSGAVISSSQLYATGAGSISIDNPANAANIENFTITPADSDDLNDFGFHNVNVTLLGATLSIDTKALDTMVSVYPNPSNGVFTIKNAGVSLQSIQVIDVNGRLVSNVAIGDAIGNQEVDLGSTLASGIYLLKIQSLQATTIKRIVIE